MELYDYESALFESRMLDERRSGAADIPARDLDRSISHLLRTSEKNAGHLKIHADAAAKAIEDPELFIHHTIHSIGHAKGVNEHVLRLRDAVARRLPAVKHQLEDLYQATPGERSATEHVPDAALAMSIGHDLDNAIAAVTNVIRHLDEGKKAQAAGDMPSVRHNIDHCLNHVKELSYHISETHADLVRKIPAVGRELDRLALLSGEDNAEWQRSMRAGWR